MLERYADYEFVPKKTIEVSDFLQLAVYDIDYMGMRLNVLENVAIDDHVVLANRIKIARKYVKCSLDPEKFT